MVKMYGIIPWVFSIIRQYPLHHLSQNPNAIELLFDNRHLCSSYYLSKNPNYEAVGLLLQNPNTIVWQEVLKTSVGILLLEYFPEQLKDSNNFKSLSINYNPIAVNIILKNPEKTDPFLLSQNKNPKILKFLSENPSFISKEGIFLNQNTQIKNWIDQHHPEWYDDPDNWNYISRNHIFADYLKENPQKIKINELCQMNHQFAINYIENYLKEYETNNNILKIDWSELSKNTFALNLLEKNKQNICPYLIQTNPKIFNIDNEFKSSFA